MWECVFPKVNIQFPKIGVVIITTVRWEILWIFLKYWYLFGVLGLPFTATACCHQQFCSNPNNTFATTKIQIQQFCSNKNTTILEKQQRKYNYSNFEQTKIIEFCSNPNKKFENDDNTDSALSHKQTNKYFF